MHGAEKVIFPTRGINKGHCIVLYCIVLYCIVFGNIFITKVFGTVAVIFYVVQWP